MGKTIAIANLVGRLRRFDAVQVLLLSRGAAAMNASSVRHEHRQQQTLTPRLQQAVRLLQLSSLDFALEVSQAMGNNPFLEVDEAEPPASESADSERVSVDDLPQPSSEQAGEIPVENWEGEGWSQYTTNRNNNSGDRDFDFADITPADQSLRDYLLAQSSWLTSSERDGRLMSTIVEALDEDGFALDIVSYSRSND